MASLIFRKRFFSYFKKGGNFQIIFLFEKTTISDCVMKIVKYMYKCVLLTLNIERNSNFLIFV